MKLRTRLILTILITFIPLGVGWRELIATSTREAIEQSTREFLLDTMQPMGRAICESHPEWFPDGPPRTEQPKTTGAGAFFQSLLMGGPPKRIREAMDEEASKNRPRGMEAMPWAYGPDLVSRNPRAPEIPERLAHELRTGAELASESFEIDGRHLMRIATWMPWREGPCAIVMVERHVPDFMQAHERLLPGLLALCGGIVLAMLVVIWPVIGRIRRLQEAVETSARDGYGTPVRLGGHDEIADLARSFDAAATTVRQQIEDLAAREQTLRRFVADTTHDVMTPLTVLQGHLAGAASEARNDQVADLARVDSSISECQYIGSLLHNLGAVAKLESGDMGAPKDRVDLVSLVERVVQRHMQFARTRDVELVHAVPSNPCCVIGDVTLLEQAIGNVVHNAVRYNHPGGHVSVALDRTDGAFTLTVLDDGPGVAPELLPRLTERSFRTREARTRETHGTGLGLGIARDVADRHGLTLELSVPHEGGFRAMFTGALTIAPSPPGTHALPESGMPSPSHASSA